MENNVIRIHGGDNVAVALTALVKGEETRGIEPVVTATEDIPAGHKIAIDPIGGGNAVIKYGCAIGYATRDIAPGEHVHTHNLRTGLSDILNYTYEPTHTKHEPLPHGTFDGFVRKDGTVGVRNDVWIIPTVGCVNGIAQRMALAANAANTSRTKVIPYAHPYGCSQMGEDQDATRLILADLARHPNAGGVLLLGLGCENSGIDTIQPLLEGMDMERIRFLVCQEAEDEMESGLTLLQELISYAETFKREPVSTEKLIVGLKCGGSDGFSGITANPVIGGFSDLLIARGGATILTEVPEMFGAETQLMARCETRGMFDKTVQLINDFKQYYQDHNQPVYENPSPGNKSGGISTLEDKSLGCTQKSGSMPIADVLAYGARAKHPGLNLLSAPGNDLVAATALAAAGAQIVLFSTGRGTPFGCPVPTVKISSNTPLALRKPTWIDFDAGRAVSEGLSIDTLGQELYDYVISVAGGQLCQHELSGIYDLAVFKRGVTL